MKILETLYGKSSSFAESLRQQLWAAWQRDPYLPAAEQHPEEMDDEDFLEFEDHVQDVLDFAEQRGIKDPQQAIVMYHDDIVKSHQAKMQSKRH